MSTKYKHGDHVPNDVLAGRLKELSSALWSDKDVRDREFTKRIPAELDRDADLVMNQAAERLTKSPWTRPDPGKPETMPEVGQEIEYLIQHDDSKTTKTALRVTVTQEFIDFTKGMNAWWAPAGTLPTMEGE